MIDDAPTPLFVPVSSATGALDLTWPPFVAHELHVWILLTAPDGPGALDPTTLDPLMLLRELIRVPAQAAAGRARVFVPVDRPLGVLLMARGEEGHPVAAPPFEVRSGPPVAEPAAPPAERSDEPRARPAIADPKKIPLIFARASAARPAPPNFELLARGLAARFSPPPKKDES